MADICQRDHFESGGMCPCTPYDVMLYLRSKPDLTSIVVCEKAFACLCVASGFNEEGVTETGEKIRSLVVNINLHSEQEPFDITKALKAAPVPHHLEIMRGLELPESAQDILKRALKNKVP